MKFALDNLVAEFQAKNPTIKVNVTYGSSGNFFAQIKNGAPFDLFFSADIRYPQKLAVAGLGADEMFLYAAGRIVVWVPKDSPLDLDKLGIKVLLSVQIAGRAARTDRPVIVQGWNLRQTVRRGINFSA